MKMIVAAALVAASPSQCTGPRGGGGGVGTPIPIKPGASYCIKRPDGSTFCHIVD
jgi:hypothetical protein